MMSYTTADLKNNTTHLQNLAQTSPILITDGDKKQVLMDYDEYKKLAKMDDEKPFVSLAQMIGYTSAADIELDEEADLSFVELEILADIDDPETLGIN